MKKTLNELEKAKEEFSMELRKLISDFRLNNDHPIYSINYKLITTTHHEYQNGQLRSTDSEIAKLEIDLGIKL